MKKRILSLLMIFCMLVSLFPVNTMATNSEMEDIGMADEDVSFFKDAEGDPSFEEEPAMLDIISETEAPDTADSDDDQVDPLETEQPSSEESIPVAQPPDEQKEIEAPAEDEEPADCEPSPKIEVDEPETEEEEETIPPPSEDKDAESEEDLDDPASAEEADENEAGVKEQSVDGEDVIVSGVCGENLEWKVTKSQRMWAGAETEWYTLDISGTGDMFDYSWDTVPWMNRGYSLNSIILQEGVTSIGANAFSCCSLQELSLPDSLRSIGAESFAQCNFEQGDLILPPSLVSIGDNAFFLSNIKSISIPEATTSISDNAFSNCENLAAIEVSPNNSVYYAFDGILYNRQTKTLIKCPVSFAGSLSIADGTEKIASYAFYNCSLLTDLFIPESVKTIEVIAFYNCFKLSHVEMLATPEIDGMNYGLFDGSSMIKTAGPIGGGYDFEFSWKEIPDGTFCKLTGLRSVTFPEGISKIGSCTFRGCSSLTSIVIPETVTVIEDLAFFESSLVSIAIPASVERIEENALASGRLKRIYIENMEAWCSNHDTYLYGNGSAILPAPSLELYLNGELIEDLIIPASVQHIPSCCFACVDSLKSVTIPASVQSVGGQAFEHCRRLESVLFSGDQLELGEFVFFSCSSLHSVTLPQKMTAIPAFMFSSCTSLTSIVIPSSVTWIMDGAFGESGLEVVTLPKSVDRIGRSVFWKSNLKTIYFEGCPTAIGDDAFQFVTADAIYYKCISGWPGKLKNYEGSLTWIGRDHNGAAVSRVEPTCYQEGSEAGVRCLSCDAILEGCEPIAKIPHTLEFHDVQMPEYDVPGMKPRWECTVCGECFSDEEGKNPISSLDDLVLYAGVIYYELNGGDNHPDNPAYYAQGYSEITLLPPSRRGYDFVGWYLDPGFRKPAESPQITQESTGDLHFYANWKAADTRYSVVFEGGDPLATGTTRSMVNLNTGKTYTLSPNGFKKTGYHFDGWLSDDGTIYQDKDKVIDLSLEGGTVVLIALWSANTYTLILDGNAGTMVDKDTNRVLKTISLQLTYDELAYLPANDFLRSGYTFTGWSSKKNGAGLTFEDMDDVFNLSAVDKGKFTLYAQWRTNKYKVYFDAGDAPLQDMYSQEFEYNKRSALFANQFINPGYRFSCWKNMETGDIYKNRASVNNLTGVDGDNIFLTAQWEVNKYSVKFSANGGKGKSPAQMKGLGYGVSKLTVPACDLVFRGYTFDCWNTMMDGTGVSYYPGDVVDLPAEKQNQVLTLYACWSFTATFDPGTGIGRSYDEELIYKRIYAFDAEYTGFYKPGYFLAGWSVSEKNAERGTVSIKCNSVKNIKPGQTLYAVWKPVSYTVVFHANAGASKEVTKIQKMTFDKVAALTPNSFRYPGHSFLGWATSRDGEVVYHNKQKQAFNFTEVEGEQIHLYAVWS